MGTTDVPLTVWQREVPAGTITLPGNKYGNPTGVGSNYIVFIDPNGNGEVSNLSPAAYQLATLGVGDPYYIDRSYTITSLPAALAGLVAIKTANNDKNNAQEAFITFTVAAAAPPPSQSPPTAVNDTATTAEDTAVTVAVLANDSDPDGDALSVMSFTQPANGVVTHDGSGVLTYTPKANFHGTDSFTYTVTDGHGADVGVVSIVVTPVNDAPLALADSITTAEDTAVTVAVLANDSDPDGDTLSVISVTQGAHGTTAVLADGTIRYTPAADYSGTDSFSYTVSDPHGATATATVSVTVTPVNDAPLAQDDSATTTAGTAVVVAVLANDSDPDGDTLSVTSVTQGAHGTTAVLADGTIRYTPAADYSGTDSFSYTVSDPHGATATATVSVTIAPAQFVMLWLEAEDGMLQAPMAAAFDEEAAGGQYVWVPEAHEDVLDPQQPGGLATYHLVVPEAGTYVLWGRVRPGATGQGSFYVSVLPGGTASAAAVSEVAPAAYEVAPLHTGDTYYIDRSYVVTAMPPELEGLTAIKTANNDKYNASAQFLTFTLSGPATLYVAYDSRATQYPAWLTQDFVNTGLVIETGDVPLVVWQRSLAAGTHSLPGNYFGSPQGVHSNYLVLLDLGGQAPGTGCRPPGVALLGAAGSRSGGKRSGAGGLRGGTAAHRRHLLHRPQLRGHRHAARA
ncbi:MAG: hypothetical protein KatS3mg131_3774 [Candidatus Tectimicrobiota bacterium]|nr:MAG: hypothetical protein KatS3mg131_3774 [Candidatus Tectomicrobia bacterium]